MLTRTFPVLLLSCALVISALGACNKNQSSTTIAGAWKSPTHDDAFGSFFVIGVGKNEDRRRLYENQMVDALKGLGAAATPSWSVFPATQELERGAVLAAVADGGFDGVILAHVLRVEDQLQYVEGKTQYVPTSNADLYMLDYDQKYEVVNEPGYYEKKTTYNIETILYTADEGEKVWWALSETVNPKTVEQIIDEVAAAAAAKLKADGLVR